MKAIAFRRNLLTVAIVLFFGVFVVPSVIAQAPDTLWTRTYGGTGYDYGLSVQQTFNGGYIIAGYTNSFGAGLIDVYLIKTDANGDSLWTRTYGGSDHDYGYSVEQTSESGYIIVGSTMSFGAGSWDAYLIRTDANGDSLWTRTYGGMDSDGGRSVQQTSDGGYIIAGGTDSFGAGDGDVYLIKTDANGDTIWTRTYGGTGYDYGLSVQQTFNGGYIIAGYTESFGAGAVDIYIIKTDANGHSLWTRTYGGTDDDYGRSVQQTFDGGYIIAGSTMSFGAGSWDAYLIRTDANGDTLWTRTYGGADGEGVSSVEQTSDSGYITVGSTTSGGAGDGDVYLIKTDANGDALWIRTYGWVDNEGGSSVQQTFDGGYIIAGGKQVFGAGYDVYLIRVASEYQPPTVIAGPDSAQNGWHDDSTFVCNYSIPFEGEVIATGGGVIDSTMWVFDDGDRVMIYESPYDTAHQYTNLSCDRIAIFTARNSYGFSASDTLRVHISQDGPPQVHSISAAYDGIPDEDIIGTFISGLPAYNTFYASASLGDCQPDSVVFELGGNRVQGSYDRESGLWKAYFSDIGYLPPGDNTLTVKACDCEGNYGEEKTAVVRMREIPTWYSGSWISLIEHHEESHFVTDGGSPYYQMEVSIPEPPVQWGPYDFSIEPFFPDLSNELKVYLGIQGRFYIEGYSDDFDCSGSLIAKLLGKGLDEEISVAQEDMVFEEPYGDLIAITIYNYEYEIPPTTMWSHKGTLMTFWVGFIPVQVKYSAAFGLSAQISFGAVMSVDIVHDSYLYLTPGIEPWVSLDVWASILFGVAEVGMNFTPTFGIEFPCTLFIYPDPGPTVHHCTYFVLYYSLWASVGWGRWSATLYEGYGFEFDHPEGCHWGKYGVEWVLENMAVIDSAHENFPQVFETPDAAVDPNSNRAMVVWMHDKHPEDTLQTDAEVYYAFYDGTEWVYGPITDNDRWETNPKVAFLSSESVIAVWTQNEIPREEWESVTDLNEVLCNQELYSSAWNISTGEWTEPVRITSNSVPDGCADLDAGGLGILTWVRDIDGDIETRTDWEIFYSWHDTSG